MPETKALNKQNMYSNFNEEGFTLLRTFANRFGITTQNVDKGFDSLYKYMYKTTNKDNFALRKSLVEYFSQYNDMRSYSKGCNEERKCFIELLKRIDNDKQIAKFVAKVVSSKYKIENCSNVLALLDTLPIEQLFRYFSNIMNIAEQVNVKKQPEILLKEMRNPFFMTESKKVSLENAILYDFASEESKIKRCFVYLKNKFNMFTEKISSKQQTTPIQETAGTENSTPNLPAVIYRFPTLENLNKPQIRFDNLSLETIFPERKFNLLEKINTSPTKKVIKDTPKIVSAAPKIETEPVQDAQNTISTPNLPAIIYPTPKLNFQRTLSGTKAKKLLIQQDVNNLIKTKLGQKTIEKQQGIYSEHATKMRLKLLPEIFESIKETRRADKLAGKKHSRSSNSDAVVLYQKIKGNNRKVVNYMLKKRDANGNRMFEIKDIIKTLNEAETQIKQLKKQDPSLKAKDVKAYYDCIFESFVEKYGKVKPTPKSKIKK